MKKASRAMSWRLIAGVAGLMAIPLLMATGYGLGRPYYTVADQDIIHVYESLRLNQGLAQSYLDHTGYISFVLLAWWFKLVHFFGLIPLDRLDALPSAGSEFVALFNEMVRAGRVFSALLAALFVLLMYVGLRRLTGAPFFALALALLFASSEGLLRQAVILRTEMASALFAFLSFFLMMEAIRRPDRAGYLGVAGLSAMLSLMAKVQSIFLLAAYPILALFLGQRRRGLAAPPAPDTTLLLGLAAVALMIPAGIMMGASIAHAGHSGWYQALLILYGLGATIAFGRIYSISVREWWRGLAAMILGLSAGQLAHLLYHTEGTTWALANFIEHMTAFASHSDKSTIERLLMAVESVLVRQVLGIPWHEIALKLILFFLVAYNIATDQHRRALCGLALLGLSLAFEVFCSFRNFSGHYYIFAQGWVLGAVAIAGANMWDKHKKVMAAGLLVLAIGQGVEVMNVDLTGRQSASQACDVAGYMTIRDQICQY
jgi:hypothetical protein